MDAAEPENGDAHTKKVWVTLVGKGCFDAPLSAGWVKIRGVCFGVAGSRFAWSLRRCRGVPPVWGVGVVEENT